MAIKLSQLIKSLDGVYAKQGDALVCVSIDGIYHSCEGMVMTDDGIIVLLDEKGIGLIEERASKDASALASAAIKKAASA